MRIREKDAREVLREGWEGGIVGGLSVKRSLVSVCMCGSLPHIQTPYTQALFCLYVVSTRVFYPVLSSFFLTPTSRTVKISWLNPQQLPPPAFLLPALLNLLPFSIQTQVFFFTSQQTLQRYCVLFPAEVTLWSRFIVDGHKNCNNKCHCKLFCAWKMKEPQKGWAFN